MSSPGWRNLKFGSFRVWEGWRRMVAGGGGLLRPRDRGPGAVALSPTLWRTEEAGWRTGESGRMHRGEKSSSLPQTTAKVLSPQDLLAESPGMAEK